MSSYEVRGIALILGKVSCHESSGQSRSQESVSIMGRESVSSVVTFKCIDSDEDIWSVRVTKSHRAVGVMLADTVTWFWIGDHDEYETFYS